MSVVDGWREGEESILSAMLKYRGGQVWCFLIARGIDLAWRLNRLRLKLHQKESCLVFNAGKHQSILELLSSNRAGMFSLLRSK